MYSMQSMQVAVFGRADKTISAPGDGLAVQTESEEGDDDEG